MGLSRRISGLAKVLTTNRIKVKILAPIARSNVVFSDNTSENFVIQRIDLRRFRSKNPEKFTSNFIQWLLFTFAASIQVIKDFTKNRCLIQYQSIYSALPALAAKLLLGARIVGDDIVLIHRFIDTLVLRLTDVVITPSLRTYSFAKRLRRFTLYIPNGVEHGLCKRQVSDLKPVLLFVGALSFDQNLKAVENIVRIASDLNENGLTFEVVIVGGPLSYAENLINHPIVKKGKVKFVGRVSNDKLTELYSSSFIGLLPFFQLTPLLGGQRTKALEFFANGLLVISGPEGVGGIDGLEPSKHYLLANSLDEMCTIVAECLSEPEKYRNIATAGASYISENYSWETLTTDYISFIHQWNR